MSTALANLAQAKQLLATSTDLREIADIKNKAEAIRAYLKASGESLETQNRAAEIRQRAIRRAGELLAKMEKQHGARGVGKKVDCHKVSPLSELNITHKQSHSWQKIAAVPEPIFEDVIAKCYLSGVELTTSRVMSAARQIPAKDSDEHEQHAKPIVECIKQARNSLDALRSIWPLEEIGTLVAILRRAADDIEKEVCCDS